MGWKTRLQRLPWRSAALFLGIVLIAVAISLIDLSPDLDHMDVRMLSGPEQGNYHAVVDRLALTAARKNGQLENQATSGTVDNLARLAAATDDCDAHFALVQDGVPSPDPDLELIGRLVRTEALLIIGPDAASYTQFSQLKNKHIGVGPPGSGTDHLARAIFESEDFARLTMRLDNYEPDVQIDMLARRQLDLGVFVVDENAAMIRRAIRDRGLQIAGFEHLDVLADKFSFVSMGRIPAGQFDPIAVVPATNKSVLRVSTLVVGNGCASRSEEIGLLMVLSETLPGFVDHNRRAGGGGQFARSATAREFIDNDGPGFADRYVPWLVDIMPLGNWIYVAMAISVLFNLLTGWHRFRLWRVDANRDKAHQIVRDVLGEQLTPAEIRDLEPTPEQTTPEALKLLDGAMADLDKLRIKCRVQQHSILVPMGKEWIYRYEETQMEAVLEALRVYRQRASSSARG